MFCRTARILALILAFGCGVLDRIDIDLFGIPVCFPGPKPLAPDDNNIASSDKCLESPLPSELQKAILDHITSSLDLVWSIMQLLIFAPHQIKLTFTRGHCYCFHGAPFGVKIVPAANKTDALHNFWMYDPLE